MRKLKCTYHSIKYPIGCGKRMPIKLLACKTYDLNGKPKGFCCANCAKARVVTEWKSSKPRIPKRWGYRWGGK